MSTPPVSNVSIFQELQSFYQNRRADIQQFGQALQSGDLNAAQQAYSTLTSLGQNGPFANSEPFARAGRAKAFEAIGQALQSGDLAGAQAAFADLHHSHAPQSRASSFVNSPAVVVTLSGAAQSNGEEPPTPVSQPLPPTAQPPALDSAGSAASTEIVVNIDGSSSSTAQSGQGPELVVNLPTPSPNGPAEEVQIHFGGSNGSGGQITIDLNQIRGKQGSSPEEISITFGAYTGNPQLVLNLLDTGTGSGVTQSQRNSLNVKA